MTCRSGKGPAHPGGDNVVNLRQFRKRKAREEARREADENAVAHGQSKAVRDLDAARRDKAARELEAHRREGDDET